MTDFVPADWCFGCAHGAPTYKDGLGGVVMHDGDLVNGGTDFQCSATEREVLRSLISEAECADCEECCPWCGAWDPPRGKERHKNSCRAAIVMGWRRDDTHL